MRGSTVKVQRSLRTRVIAACALAFLGLAAVVCLVIPRAYEAQRRATFVNRAEVAVRGLAYLLEKPGQSPDASALAALSGFLVADPDFESATVFRTDGQILAQFPAGARPISGPIPTAPTSTPSPTGCAAYRPLLGDGTTQYVAAVRLTSQSLVRDFENVRWLFASIFLFTSGVFFILSQYLTRTILSPIEEIGRAAMNLADGEPVVEVPRTGDREIDDLGEFISKLGESRRHSRVMTSPMDVILAQSWGHSRRLAASAKNRPEPESPTS
jgi:hypothetical protein